MLKKRLYYHALVALKDNLLVANEIPEVMRINETSNELKSRNQFNQMIAQINAELDEIKAHLLSKGIKEELLDTNPNLLFYELIDFDFETKPSKAYDNRFIDYSRFIHSRACGASNIQHAGHAG